MPPAGEIREFFNAVGPAMRNGGAGPNGPRHEMSANDRVNNMSQQQFDDHMNELFLRDNQKPISANLLSQLPRSRYRVDKIDKSA